MRELKGKDSMPTCRAFAVCFANMSMGPFSWPGAERNAIYALLEAIKHCVNALLGQNI